MTAPERIWADEVFWPFVMISNDCWFWSGPKMGNGYGSVRPKKGAYTTGAHRFSWALHNGFWPPVGSVVLKDEPK